MPANRQTVPRAAREAEILAAAQAVFTADGFDQASIASIARRAGMTSANVHYYFATKDALFAAMARSSYDELFAALAALADPLERLRGYVHFHLAHHALRGTFLAIAARSSELTDVLVRREDWLADTAAELTRDELDAAALVATVTGLIEAARPHPDADDVLEHAVARFVRTRSRTR
jgi:AcrR family transcriptional regulator